MFDSPLSSSPLSAGAEAGSGGMTVDLAGDAVVVASASGALYPTYLIADAQSVATAAGALSSALELAASGGVQTGATGNLSVLAALSGSASVLASTIASVSQSMLLSGAASGSVSASGSLSTETAMAGAAVDTVSASGVLSALSGLAGIAATIANAAGTLDQGITVAGAAQALADASSALSNTVALSASALAKAEATGGLTLSKVITGNTTYAINMQSGAVTTWENCDFERLVQAHGKLYGLRAGTLYRIGGDTDPSSVAIEATVRFSSSNFGSPVLSRLDQVYIGSRAVTGMEVTPIYDETLGRSYLSTPNALNGISPHKVDVGRGNRFHTLGFRIRNRQGGPLDIGAIEPLIHPLQRRIN